MKKKIVLFVFVAIALIITIGAVRLYAKGTPPSSPTSLYDIEDEWDLGIYPQFNMLCKKKVSGRCGFICPTCAYYFDSGLNYKFHSINNDSCPGCGSGVEGLCD